MNFSWFVAGFCSGAGFAMILHGDIALGLMNVGLGFINFMFAITYKKRK